MVSLSLMTTAEEGDPFCWPGGMRRHLSLGRRLLYCLYSGSPDKRCYTGCLKKTWIEKIEIGHSNSFLAQLPNFSSTLLNFSQLFSSFLNLSQLFITFINFYQLLSTFINFYQLSSTFFNFPQLTRLCTNFVLVSWICERENCEKQKY